MKYVTLWVVLQVLILAQARVSIHMEYVEHGCVSPAPHISELFLRFGVLLMPLTPFMPPYDEPACKETK